MCTGVQSTWMKDWWFLNLVHSNRNFTSTSRRILVSSHRAACRLRAAPQHPTAPPPLTSGNASTPGMSTRIRTPSLRSACVKVSTEASPLMAWSILSDKAGQKTQQPRLDTFSLLTVRMSSAAGDALRTLAATSPAGVESHLTPTSTFPWRNTSTWASWRLTA